MKAKLNTPKELENIINQFDRKRTEFTKVNARSIRDFPRVRRVATIQNNITLGSYQLRQSLSYLSEYQRKNENFEIEVFNDNDKIFDCNHRLLRANFSSRHIASKTYKTYITYQKNDNSLEKINWVCNCRNGNRTVGCCSHVASLVYHLNYGKYHTPRITAAFLDTIFPSATIIESTDDEDDDNLYDEYHS